MTLKNTLRRTLGYLPYLLCLFLLSFREEWTDFLMINAIAQLLIFLFFACLPAYFTRRMSYVDIAWPWGLVAIGVTVLVLGEGYWLRNYIIAGLYLMSGLRMGLGALVLFRKGHLNTELSRYKFQRKRWEKLGYSNENLSLQYEIMVQCLANISFLAIPALLQYKNPQETLTVLEIIGYSLWLLFFIIEHLADLQKQRFLIKCRLENKKRQVCNVGLWRYSRHPNYFAEWMVWNALICASISSLWGIYGQEGLWFSLALFVATLFISRLMYSTLVYYTGAVPSEYYSLQKRPGYKKHQEETSMFFPRLPQKVES
ncbi:MAG: DUF1295 domain-containing protein [Flavobacteriaceae bacterium]